MLTNKIDMKLKNKNLIQSTYLGRYKQIPANTFIIIEFNIIKSIQPTYIILPNYQTKSFK